MTVGGHDERAHLGGGLSEAGTLLVAIPARFTEMLQQTPELASEWRFATRDLFATCFARGSRVVDFLLDPVTTGGLYVVERSARPTG